MKTELPDAKQTWISIGLFMTLLTCFSSIAYFAILKLNPTSIYVGALMMSPALAALFTLKILKRPVSSLPWRLKELRYLKYSYLIPVLYISLAYFLIWILGLGQFYDSSIIKEWSEELGINHSHSLLVATVMIFLLASVGVIKNIGSVLGEEIGWRGFFIFELRKIFSFKWVSILSGLVWAIWHWPIIFLIYKNSGNVIFHLCSFTIMILGMSVILAYYTFKSNSLWPAALFHSVHNIYIQKIYTPLTLSTENSNYWIDEYGLMIPLMTTLFGFYYWHKAVREKL